MSGITNTVATKIYTPAGTLVIERVKCALDTLFKSLEIDPDGYLSDIVINEICESGVEICVEQ